MIASLVRSVLRRFDYTVVAVPALDAIARLRGDGDFDGILVTNAPGYFVEFADTLRLLYLSSSPDPELEVLFPRCRVVRKPFLPADLVRAVNDLAAL